MLSVMPNAGYPTIVDGRTFFENRAGYFAARMVEIVAAGAKIIGGCCGTTPEHIRLTAEALNEEEIKPVASKSSRPQCRAMSATAWRINSGRASA